MKMSYPNKWELSGLLRYVKESAFVNIETDADTVEWVPARPIGFPSFKNRITSAWLVFTGRADVLQWPHQ